MQHPPRHAFNATPNTPWTLLVQIKIQEALAKISAPPQKIKKPLHIFKYVSNKSRSDLFK